MTLHLSIEVDEPVRVGESFTATVIVEATKEHAVNGLSLTLEAFHPFDTSSDAFTQFLEEKVGLLGVTTIAPGRHEHRAELTLPEGSPPSIPARGLRYVLKAWVGILWWFDVSEERDVRVSLPPLEERPAPRPVTVTSDERGEDALFLELTVDDTTVSPGESITGSFSVGNLRGARLDGATIAVVPRQGAVDGSLPDASVVWKSLVRAEEGSVVGFAIPIPADTPLSCTTSVGAIARDLRLRIDGYSATCSLPITIAEYERRAEGTAEQAGPLGAVRWRLMWRDEGARHGLALDGRELRLRGKLADEVSVKVRSQGVGLGSTLRWESLGIGLSIEKRGVLPLAGVDLYGVDPRLADRFTVRGHEEAQVQALFEDDGLCSALLSFDEVTVDDEGARVSSARPARDEASLGSFLDMLDALSRAIVATAPRLPPPAWASPEMVETWRRYAEASGARFFPGRIAILGAVADGDRVDLRTLLDKRHAPSHTRITLVLERPLEHDAPGWAQADLMRSVTSREPRVEIRAEEIVLELSGRTEDPDSLRAPIAEMQRLARRLRGENERGPYR